MDNKINLLSTIEGSSCEGFYPKGWNLEKIDQCIGDDPKTIFERQAYWNKDFSPEVCETIEDFEVKLGHEIALEIKTTKDEGRELVLILPVGPMGMYRWAVHFLKEWKVDCSHVHGFNMDEWSDKEGNTLEGTNPRAFQNAMQNAFYEPLGKLTVPEHQRNFATKNNLPTYHHKINELVDKGAKLVTVYGIGRTCHIAFWEPHFAAEYDNIEDWKNATHRLGGKLHPLTIEQNSLTSYKGRFTQIPATANTVGPGLFLKSDKMIGGCDGIFGRGMQWQGVPLWVTLRYQPDIWVPSSFVPTLPGKLYFVRELAGPLEVECN